MSNGKEVKPYPQQLPNYTSTPSKDLTAFQNKFNKATADNRILKTNQLGKFREVLIGNPVPRIP